MRTPERRDRRRLAQRGLDRVSGPHPRVVPAVEDPDVTDPGVVQDHRRPGGGDLPGAASGPLLVRSALGVAAEGAREMPASSTIVLDRDCEAAAFRNHRSACTVFFWPEAMVSGEVLA